MVWKYVLDKNNKNALFDPTKWKKLNLFIIKSYPIIHTHMDCYTRLSNFLFVCTLASRIIWEKEDQRFDCKQAGRARRMCVTEKEIKTFSIILNKFLTTILKSGLIEN